MLRLVVVYLELHEYEPPSIQKPIQFEELGKNLRPADTKFISSLTLK